jgi:hypothetical protein
MRVNFTPELWEAAARELREKYSAQLAQIREDFQDEAISIPRLALELEIARRLGDTQLTNECEAEMRSRAERTMSRLMLEMDCQRRIAELDKLLSEDGART